MIVRQGLPPVALGLAAGAGVSLLLGRLLGSLLFGVRTGDPLTLACVTALLALVAAGATYLPARRSTRIDPMTALHDE